MLTTTDVLVVFVEIIEATMQISLQLNVVNCDNNVMRIEIIRYHTSEIHLFDSGGIRFADDKVVIGVVGSYNSAVIAIDRAIGQRNALKEGS